MKDEQPKGPSEADKELEREIRAKRKFTVAEAIGRLAGPGAMKGVSPISGKQQAIVEIHQYLSRHLPDNGGALRTVVLTQVKDCDLLLTGFEQPLVVLAGYVLRVLDSENLLEELVRDADVEWGRVFEERPHFEQSGRAPHPDDPYTLDSVRASLTRLMDQLARDKAVE